MQSCMNEIIQPNRSLIVLDILNMILCSSIKVLYDDGDVEVLNLAKEKWTLIESNDSSVKVRVLTTLSFSVSSMLDYIFLFTSVY
jgi:hypothetical protein